MTSTPSARSFEVRHLQLARAALAAIAALMVTFSSDHSAALGMSVFSGFAIVTGLVLLLATWSVYPAGRRWPSLTLAAVALVAGLVASFGALRTIEGFFVTVVAWALVSGAIELIAGWRDLRHAKNPGLRARREVVPGVYDSRPVIEPGPPSESRDGIVVGIITMALGLGLLAVPTQYALQYAVAEQSFTLTGIIIAVGLFGGYAAVVAVYLAIAGFSPRKAPALAIDSPVNAPADQRDPA